AGSEASERTVRGREPASANEPEPDRETWRERFDEAAGATAELATKAASSPDAEARWQLRRLIVEIETARAGSSPPDVSD
ncbi:MAG: hypothetical protein AAF602_25710, partial [Myxococcota bacterium]